MPWKEIRVMDQKVKLIADYLEGSWSKVELSRYYGISRKTVDKWIRRYEEQGAEGLKDRLRRPHSSPQQTPLWMQQQIIETKLAHQSFGPKKVMDWLRREKPGHAWPADSTAGEILKRAGLVKVRKKRARVQPDSQPFRACQSANAVWSMDFKGHFALGNGQRCHPLTISDNYSRYLLQCRGLSKTRTADVQPWIEWTFREYGMPLAIRSDNGPPFASMALGGISQLSKWWIRLGIKPERIEPGKPQQNGRHERMHGSLKRAVVSPPRYSLGAQQRAFDAYLQEFNEQRSHEGLDRKRPADVYQVSSRGYPNRLPSVDYDQEYEVRQVRHNGEIKWQGKLLYLSQVLVGDKVGLKQIDDDHWEIYYCSQLLGIVSARENKIVPLHSWHGKNGKKM